MNSTTTCAWSTPKQIDGGGNLVPPFDHTGRWQLTAEQCVTISAGGGGGGSSCGLTNDNPCYLDWSQPFIVASYFCFAMTFALIVWFFHKR